MTWFVISLVSYTAFWWWTGYMYAKPSKDTILCTPQDVVEAVRLEYLAHMQSGARTRWVYIDTPE